jgi:hypothetical protein
MTNFKLFRIHQSSYHTTLHYPGTDSAEQQPTDKVTQINYALCWLNETCLINLEINVMKHKIVLYINSIVQKLI